MNMTIGVDIFNVKRIKQAMAENQDYVTYVFSEEEIRLSEGHADVGYYYGSLFSIKEAMFKSLNIFWQDEMDWKDFNVSSVPYSHPRVFLSGKTKALVDSANQLSFSASNSYDGDYIMSSVLCVRDN